VDTEGFNQITMPIDETRHTSAIQSGGWRAVTPYNERRSLADKSGLSNPFSEFYCFKGYSPNLKIVD